ncbi:MAG: hypothetical protein WC058_16215 [Phycisphaeraceae bacterium]
MSYFASDDDKRIAGLVENIRKTIRDELDGVPGDPGWCDPLSSMFGPDMTLLCGWIRANMPTLDLAPLENVYRQIVRRRNRDDPTEADCFSLEDEAMLVLGIVQESIMARIRTGASASTTTDDSSIWITGEEVAVNTTPHDANEHTHDWWTFMEAVEHIAKSTCRGSTRASTEQVLMRWSKKDSSMKTGNRTTSRYDPAKVRQYCKTPP